MNAVIFDLDGTLQTLELDFGALRGELSAFFGRHGLGPLEGPLLEAVEASLEELARRGMPAPLLEEVRREAGGRMDAAELASYPRVRTIDGVPEMLRELSKRGLRMAVLSRACRPFVERSLERIGFRFDAVASREEVHRPKPDPEGIFRVLGSLGASAGEAVVIGDHPFDILAGRRAGARTVGVLTGSGTREALERAGADAVLPRADGALADWLLEDGG